METWFAKIVIACVGIHDILLWVALGFATAIASEGSYTAGIAFKSIGISLSFILGTLFIGYFLFKTYDLY